jgi:AraC family transcriptional regulator, exoenzyme S synthesis regulatory protein ExsA
MINFVESVMKYPEYSRQFNCGKSLITVFKCPPEARLMPHRFTDLWSQHNYILYVIDGKKIWHTAQGSYDLQKGKCVFVQKGASIIEQFFDAGFCLILFFIPDEFICDTLKTKFIPINSAEKKYNPVMLLDTSETLAAFFLSVYSYFAGTTEPDQRLLELKFRELILTIADNPRNVELQSFFCSLLYEPQSVSLQRVMEDNYCFSLTLEQYARLSNRSLSSFKRDFQKQFNTSPGKWLMEKRLHHAMHLLSDAGKTSGESAFESGFKNSSHFSRAFRQRFGRPPSSIKQRTVVLG